ncbi:MAG: septation protein SpoVG family protein, partial [Candidatus Omnitrophica bacterium]|nr:septation protein SpoVG family protein [Candidatus Omnitrophota bacterium]
CGASLPQPLSQMQETPQTVRQSEHRDIAHPITLECREKIQNKVLKAFEDEAKKTPQDRDRSRHEERISFEDDDDLDNKDIAL